VLYPQPHNFTLMPAPSEFTAASGGSEYAAGELIRSMPVTGSSSSSLSCQWGPELKAKVLGGNALTWLGAEAATFCS
jgi:hypothetical protein